MSHPNDKTASRRILSIALVVVFLLAMFMGCGPGVLLITPDLESGELPDRLFRMPILYVWTCAWYLVQATVIVTAYFTVWRTAEHKI